jgi:hypothetical protein
MSRWLRFIAVATGIAFTASCGGALRQSRSPVLLVVNQLQGAPTGGHGANQFGSPLLSDVVVLVRTPAPCSDTSPCATIFNDVGQVALGMSAKNIDVAPTNNNQVTITRYHVEYIRADGRNTPGVDVPFPFDGTLTGTVPAGGTATLTFELVRHTAKEESPLVQLQNNGAIIHTLAQVTFYGRDLVGNDISVTGSLSVDFGNFGDQ